jgi:hypothetical protein
MKKINVFFVFLKTVCKGIHFGQGLCRPIVIEREQLALFAEFADSEKERIQLALLGLENKTQISNIFKPTKNLSLGHFLELGLSVNCVSFVL